MNQAGWFDTRTSRFSRIEGDPKEDNSPWATSGGAGAVKISSMAACVKSAVSGIAVTTTRQLVTPGRPEGAGCLAMKLNFVFGLVAGLASNLVA
jgi:hypothetical protein